MLWFALHFPYLPIEALFPRLSRPEGGAANGVAAGAGVAVVFRGRIAARDSTAAVAGVMPGQRLSTALGLAPGLVVHERNGAREQAALESLACWAGNFTPQVSLAPPATLLLEIDGCLRLFGGARAIVDLALAGCAEQGYSTAWAVAPTAQGATWLAWSGASCIFSDQAVARAALAALPCAVADWPAEVQSRLQSFGLDRLGELRRLPGAGLRQRLGPDAMEEMARAWGDLPDPRPAFVFPERFTQGLELPCRVEHAGALAFAAQRLFAALTGWLHSRQLAVRTCRLQLTHDDGSRSELLLHLAEPTAEEGRLGRLLREHLARLELAVPVVAIDLAAADVTVWPGSNGQLFAQAVAGEGALACLERLRGRLGEGAVYVLGQCPDYRPEGASQARAPGLPAAPAAVPAGARPLWLLPVPQPLAEQHGRPVRNGSLGLLTRAERLESGWWDAGDPGGLGDVRRDYFIAGDTQGRCLWIFRDSEGWFLHGFFA